MEALKNEKQQEPNIQFQTLLYSLSEYLSSVKLKRDQILFRINDIGEHFYIILSGRVGVLKPSKKQKSCTFKEYYNFLLKLLDKDEEYLFKLNLKANSDIFFNSVEDFKIYQNMLIKTNIKEMLFDSSTNKDNAINKIKKEINLETNNSLNIYEDYLLKLKSQDEQKFLINLRNLFEPNSEEVEIHTKYHPLINLSIEVKNFIYYDYDNFMELRNKQFFGDFALDIPDRKRTSTIIAYEDTVLACLPSEVYLKYLFGDITKFRNRDVALLNNFIVFKHIKQIHFEKNYFQDFAPFEFEKDQVIFKQGEQLEKLIIIKSGSIDLYLNANLVEINLIIKNLILKAKGLGIFTSTKATDLMEKLYDGLNVTNKSSSYFDSLLKKKNFLLYNCSKAESPAIESIMLNIPALYKGVIKSDRCKVFKLETDKMNYLLKSYEECKLEYLSLVENKVEDILNRLFNIKKCLVCRYSSEYELQTKNDKLRLASQLKNLEEADKQLQESKSKPNNGLNNNHSNSNNNNENNLKNSLNRINKKNNDNNSNSFINSNINIESFPIRQNIIKETTEDLINDFRPYKNIRNQKISPERLKVNYQEVSELKQNGILNLNELNPKSKQGNFYTTNLEFFKKENEANKNSLINTENRNNDLNKTKYQITKSFLDIKEDKSIVNNNKTSRKIDVLSERHISAPKSTKKLNKLNDSERKMSFLEFPINKIKTITNEKLNKFINISSKNIAANEEIKTEESKASEIDKIRPTKKYYEYPTQDENKLFNSKSLFPNNEEKKITNDLTKLMNSNTNNTKLLNLFREFDKKNQYIKPKKDFLVSIKDFEKTAEEVNFNQKNYYKNMMKFKVRNDVNQLINSKNEKEMYKTIINFSVTGSQNKLFSPIQNKSDENLIKSLPLFYNHSSKNFNINNFNNNIKRFSVEIPNSSNDNFNNFKKTNLIYQSNSLNIGKNIHENTLNKFDITKKFEFKSNICNSARKNLDNDNSIKKEIDNKRSRKISMDFINHNFNTNIHNKKLYSMKNANIMSLDHEYNKNNFYDKTNNHINFNKYKNRNKDSSPEDNNYRREIMNKKFHSLKINQKQTFNSLNLNKFKSPNSMASTQEKFCFKLTSGNPFFKKNEAERDLFRESNYFDKYSNFNSTSNGFSTSDKNFRTTLESYLPRKTHNQMLSK